jgi:hypothetical protein
MARIWTEPFDSARHRDEMQDGSPAAGITRYYRARTLEPHEVLFVRVAGFTFQFQSVDQLRACLEYYATKLHPTSRAPIVHDGDHWESQRWFERLPLFLREEPKRQKVVAALEEALHQFTRKETGA